MPTNFIGDISAALAGAAVLDVQPPAGEAWKVTEFSSDVAFVADVPDISVGITTALLATCIVIPDPTVAGMQKGDRAKEILIDNVHYMQITNAGLVANVGWCGVRINVNNIRTDVVTVPNAGDYDIRPPVGEVWRITEIGMETIGATFYPDATFFITDGVLVLSMIMIETADLNHTKIQNWYVSNDVWVRVTDTSVAPNDLAFCAELVDVEQFADVVDVLTPGAGLLDIQPAVGQQAVITQFAAETWGGVLLTAGSPDMTVSFYDGANLSDIMEAGSVSDSLASGRTINIMIDNAHYLRVVDVSGADNQVGYLGYIFREFT